MNLDDLRRELMTPKTERPVIVIKPVTTRLVWSLATVVLLVTAYFIRERPTQAVFVLMSGFTMRVAWRGVWEIPVSRIPESREYRRGLKRLLIPIAFMLIIALAGLLRR